eukprot:TRINITY_DN5487_c0_g1_i10.p2 TRINITY_DN5487_c0_g1~~TRINITY_DN5487_c0_g1_i10.p2  ORF type:complete len:190 (-),score=41.28 TRINITY_DN5487_c0_g1_i10:67-636(-)
MGACGSTEKLQKKPARSLSGLRAPAEEPEPIEKPPDFVLRLAHPETPFELSCDPDSRVEELLRQVAVRLGCPAEQFELFSIVFSDIQLEPSSQLSEAGVCEGAECTLVTEAWEAWESAQAEKKTDKKARKEPRSGKKKKTAARRGSKTDAKPVGEHGGKSKKQKKKRASRRSPSPVSYTHLTLPTKRIV